MSRKFYPCHCGKSHRVGKLCKVPVISEYQRGRRDAWKEAGELIKNIKSVMEQAIIKTGGR